MLFFDWSWLSRLLVKSSLCAQWHFFSWTCPRVDATPSRRDHRVVSSSRPPLHKPTSFHRGQFRTVSLFIIVDSSWGRATQPYLLTCVETKCNCHRQILVCHTISWLQKWVCLNADHFTMDPAIKAAYIVYKACQISGNSLVLPHLTFQMMAQTASGFTILVIINHFWNLSMGYPSA